MDETITDHYVYIYMDPRRAGHFLYGDLTFDHEPFYVGSGRGYRKNYHLSETDDNCKNKPKHFKIKKIKSCGLLPIIHVFKNGLTKAESIQLESEVMLKIGFKFNKTGPLLNFKTSYDENIQVKKLFGDSNPMYGRTVFDFWYEKYGASIAETKIDEYKRKMSIATSGKRNGMYGSSRTGSDNPNYGKGKIVEQIDDNGLIVAEWPNVPAAARHLSTSIGKSEKSIIANIYKSISTGNTAWKYRWKYKIINK